MYLTGYPDFSIEKPILALYNPVLLADQQKSQEFYGELKLKIKRGFITIDYMGAVACYRHGISIPDKSLGDAIDQLKQQNLPPRTIFDGGIFIDDTPKLYIFDVLVYKGKELRYETCLQRRKLLEILIKNDDLIWRPHRCDFWFQEFVSMLRGDSSLIKRAALNYGVPHEKLLNSVEGLVMKNKKARLKFPNNVAFSSNFFKLKLEHVLTFR